MTFQVIARKRGDYQYFQLSTEGNTTSRLNSMRSETIPANIGRGRCRRIRYRMIASKAFESSAVKNATDSSIGTARQHKTLQPLHNQL